jgi:hypothetical protein
VPTIKRIVCLANSRKLSGRCIAGREFDGRDAGAWVRPVSGREHEKVSEYERQYEDGSDPKLLDIIDIPLIEARPKTYQCENWLIDGEGYWVLAGRLVWEQLTPFRDAVRPLWIDGSHTANGMNDQIALAYAADLNNSLRLIHANGVEIHVIRTTSPFGPARRRVQGRFDHAGQTYWLWVTDPVIERAYLAQPNGQYRIGESFMTISLSEPFEGHCYKLIAAIITRKAIGA